MVLAKSKKTIGLGNQLMKDRFGKGRGVDQKKTSAVTRINHATGEQYITNDKEEASWVKMRSITEQSALDEFLATATLADTDFTAEKKNGIQIFNDSDQNRFLLSMNQERAVRAKHRELKHRLSVPRRPKWSSNTTPAELDAMERAAFLDWRRRLAELDEVQDLLLTPFERNLEVWKQLWRVIERSDIVVQIVDARNPLLFRSEDLEDYVKSIDSKRRNLLLLNKADLLSEKQRKSWASYLKEHDIDFRFFSAHLANEANQAEQDTGSDNDAGEEYGEDEDDQSNQEEASDDGSAEEDIEATSASTKPTTETAQSVAPPPENQNLDTGEPDDKQPLEPNNQEVENDTEVVNHDEALDDDIKILSVDELHNMFLELAPDREYSEKKLAVGLVGYPNVGKSSTINALCGAKKVSVSATPGKTKHFQTIHLSDEVLLCDCPGLVFPNFAATKAELVCNGVLPIDQMREFTGPAGLVSQRIPKAYLEAIYGITIKTKPIEEGGSGVPTAHELLDAYARARGFFSTGHGTSDMSRAARVLLKDYVHGKLLYCEPPPGVADGTDFNRELYTVESIPSEKRRAALTSAIDSLDIANADLVTLSEQTAALHGNKSRRLDREFFRPGAGSGVHMQMPFNYKYSAQGRLELLQQQQQQQGKVLSRRKMRQFIAAQTGVDPRDVQLDGKKFHKGPTKSSKKKKKTSQMDDE